MTGLGFNARRRALATVITVIALVSGAAASVLAFDDVPDGSYFEDAVAWTDDQDIANGRPSGLFDPFADVTRGEFVTMMWRLAGEPDADPSSFSDVPAGAFFETAVGWAEDVGLTTGTGDGKFSPYASTKRSEVVTFLWRYACRPAEAADHGFTDVVAGSFYELAVKWAKVEEITTGTTATTFDPNGITNRAQAATFVWRLAGMPEVGDPGSSRTTALPSCNTAPELDEIGAKMAAEGVELSFTATAFDDEDDDLTFTLDDGEAGAVPAGAAITTGGDFTWTPTEAQDGAHTFDVVVTDDGDPMLEDRETITVTVGEGNTSPSDPDEGSLGAPAFTAVGNTQLQVTGGTAAASGLATTTATTNLLTGATDPDVPAQTLSVTAQSGAATANGGVVDVFADGTFTYVSAPGFTGVDHFMYDVCDDFSTPACDSSKAYITVADTVFYVDADGGNDGTGDGTSVAAFASLAPLDSGGSADTTDSAGDIIYVLDPAGGIVDGGIVLENQQKLLGQGVDLVVDSTTLISATDKPTIRATAGAGITLAVDNTVRGLDIDAPGGKGIEDSGSGVGTLTISDIDSVSTTNNTAVDIEGPGTSTVTIGTVTATHSGGVRIGNHSTGGSTFTFTAINSSGSSGDGVNIFGVNSPTPASTTISLGTVTVTKTGTGNDGIHVLNSLQTPVSSTGGTISVGDASGLSMTNGHFDLTLTSVSSDGGSTPGIDLKNQEGTVTITGDGGAIDHDGSGGTIANKTGAGIKLEGTKGLTFTELDVTAVAGHGIDATDPRSGPNVFRGGVISGVDSASGINIVAAKSSNVVVDQMIIDGESTGVDGIKVQVDPTGSINLDITDTTIDAFLNEGIDIAADDTSDLTITGNTIGGTTPVGGRGLMIVTDSTLATAVNTVALVDNNAITTTSAFRSFAVLTTVTGTGTADLQLTATSNTIDNTTGVEAAFDVAAAGSSACLDFSANALVEFSDLDVDALAALTVVKVADAAALQAANTVTTLTVTGTPTYNVGGACTLPS